MDGEPSLSVGHTQNIQILQTVENLLTRFHGEYFLLALSPQYRQTNCQISSYQGKEFLSKNLHIIQDFLQHCYDVTGVFYDQLTSEGGDGRSQEQGGAGDMEVTVINTAISRLEKAIAECDQKYETGIENENDTKEWNQEGMDASKAQEQKQECVESEHENGDCDDGDYAGNDTCTGSSHDDSNTKSTSSEFNTKSTSSELNTKSTSREFNTKSTSSEFTNLKLKKEGNFKFVKKEKSKFRAKKAKFADSLKQSKETMKKKLKNSPQKLTCDICGEKLEDEESMKEHLSIHESEGEENQLFECEMCGLRFRVLEDFETHIASHSNVDTLQCTICKRTFRNQKTLISHVKLCSRKADKKEERNKKKSEALKMQSKVVENQDVSNSLDAATMQKEGKSYTLLECPSCYGMVHSEEEFLSHMESHGTTLADTCLHCQEEFHDDLEMARHIILSHIKQRKMIGKRKNATLKMITTPSTKLQNEKWILNANDGSEARYKCPNCQTIFKNIKCFAYHLNSYAINGRNHCGICHRFFTYKSNLTKHMKYTHSDLKNFICDVCGKSFKHNDSLKIHKKGHEEGGGSNLECMECGKLLSCTTALKVHMRRHTGSTPYMCEICGKAFKQSSNLQKHMLVHTTETLFKCEICGKEFKYQETYKNHMTAHILKSGKAEGNKTQFSRIYTCEYCGKQFSTGSQHKVHLRTHTNERPYKCKQCDKAFKEHGKLSRHMKIHGMDGKTRSRSKGNAARGGIVSKKSAISYNDTIMAHRPEDSIQCVIMENQSSASVSTPQTISIPTPQAMTVPHDHTQVVPLPPQTDVSMNVVQGMEGQAPDSDTGTVLLQMMPSSQYQHYVSPPPQIQVPHPQGQPDSAHTGGYEVQQYFRSFTFQSTSLEGHPL